MSSFLNRACTLFAVMSLIGQAGYGTVLDPPELRCSEVLANGDAVLTWLQPLDPTNEFSSYEIYSANTFSGPFVTVGSIAVYGQLSFTHVGANADQAQIFYYLQTVSTSPPPNNSLPSDTLGTIYLEVSQSTPLGSAVLDWTPPSIPLIGSSNAQYDIYKEYPPGTWTLLGQVPVTSNNYGHVISICDDTLNFRIELGDASGCVSISNVAGDQFQDQTPPSPPIISSVTVDSITGLANINWTPSPEGDTDGYIIVQVINGNAIILDTVYGGGSDFYEYLNSDAGNAAEFFTIAAFDTCWSGTPPSPNTSATLPLHNTIHLTTQLDRCASEITLNWNEYVNWPGGVQRYSIYTQENSSPYALIATLPPGTTSYTHVGLSRYSNYCYIVEAIEEGGPNYSLSNIVCRTVDYPPLPTFNYVATATVQTNGVPLVSNLIDPTAEVQNYKVFRSDNGAPYEHVGTIPSSIGPYITYQDYSADSDKRSYEYKVQVTDSCGNESITSNKGSTMLLRVQSELNGLNNLNWNGYVEWAGIVGLYNIYRKAENDAFYVLVATVPMDQWYYSDDVSALYNTNGLFCYYVEAVESGNPITVDETSASNIVCAVQDAAFYVPNAFIAGSSVNENTTFGPIFSFTNVSNYEFIIYNRWGMEIFRTSTPNKPWDGSYNGEFVQEGVYAYYVNYQNGEGRTYTRKGTVTFLHGFE